MAKHTIDELLKASEAQSRRDKVIISECIDGLGLYAAHKARDNRNSPDVDKMRKLARALVCYWGLNEGENAKSPEEYLWDFDVRVDNAKYRPGEEVTGDTYRSCVSVIYGLNRYGMELVVTHGDSAMKDILAMADLMKEVAGYWNFEPYIIAEDLAAKLYAEVRVMLDGVTLPGQSVSGRSNINYEFRQAILFDNDRGFVLAHNRNDPAAFVTWQFTNEDGNLSFYWGHYLTSEEKARIDYMSRVAEYKENYKLTEKPLPTIVAEINAEQNYNMIDGVHNNEAFPQPDLTDGQTYEEIRELAPEMLPDESMEEPEAIPVQIMTESQPLVTVTFSELDQLRGITRMPLYLADALFAKLDAMPREERSEDGALYHKTDFRIDFIRNSEPDSYTGHYDVGSGHGSLVDHIQRYSEYNRNEESPVAYLSDRSELVQYFRTHCVLSLKEADALSRLMGIHETAAEQPSETDIARITYLESVVEYANHSRAALNSTGLDGLPKPPQPAAKIGHDEKPSVLKRIRDAQKTPCQPSKPKPEREKKTREPDL